MVYVGGSHLGVGEVHFYSFFKHYITPCRACGGRPYQVHEPKLEGQTGVGCV
jgi:hypothetical protein